MAAKELFQAGKLDEAIETLGTELRSDPTDVQRRSFLFELLCFAGQYDRAEKQLDVLSGANQQAMMGTLLYRSALHAERTRQAMFDEDRLPIGGTSPKPVTGTLNGKPFSSLVDGDDRIGGRLEIFAAGQYTWLPLAHIASVRTETPKRLRDLLWIPAIVRTGPGFKGVELGEVLLPVMTPLAWRDPNPAIRLGRMTEWRALDESRQAPAGQKMWLVDDEEVPLLEVRELEIDGAEDAGS